MREKLFKAKAKDNGEWVEGYYAMMGKGENAKHYIIQNGAIPALFKNEEDNMYFNDVEIDPETVCQYIGQIDKKGNKIWENDIVQYEFEATFDYRKKYREVVLIDDFTFYLIMPTLARCGELEVLGNRFDTPELLSQCINFLVHERNEKM